MKQKGKNGKIELLRFAFALIVLLLHSSTFATADVKSVFQARGGVSVEFFFLLSGYFMAASAYKQIHVRPEHLGLETRQFLGRKIQAIMPNFIVAWIIAFIVTIIRDRNASVWHIISRFISCIWEPLHLTMAGFGASRVNGVDWYISAMLLCMLILYPLCRAYTENFVHIIAPAIAIFVLGYIYHENGTTLGVMDWIGLGYRGLFRALAMLSLGAALYPAVKAAQSWQLSGVGKSLVSLTELCCWIGVFLCFLLANKAKYDFFCILLISIGIILALSHQGRFADIFDHSICYFLGKFSLSLYLSHVSWGRLLGKWYREYGYYRLLYIYIFLSFATALLVYAVSEFLRKHKNVITSIKNILLENQSVERSH